MNFDKLFSLAKEKGIEDLQIHYVKDNELEIEVFGKEVNKYSIASPSSLRVKGIYDGKMGTVSTEKIDDTMHDFIVDSIIDSAKFIENNDEVFIYEGDDNYSLVEGLYNSKIEDIENTKKINDTLELEKMVLAQDERVKMVQAFYGETKRDVVIKNSKGLDLKKTVNNAVFGAYVIASDGDDQRTGLEYIQSNDYKDFNFEKMAKESAEKACGLLGAGPCDSGEYEILLENDASASLIAAYLSIFSAESVQKDVSLLKGKLNTKIANDIITLVDDPFMKKSVKSGSFDDEGVSTKYKEVVSKGVLTTYLHNLKTAKKDGIASTGNGYGNGIAPSNLYIKPGKHKKEEVIAGINKGLLITSLAGLHSGANAISGDFSLQATGYLIEAGKITSPVALITVAGNYLDLMNNVVGVCDDIKYNFNYIGSPSIHIKSLSVSGK
ncbi:hypothetical protein CI105_01125 [Candidatus Izimaplasma bacterium ZiA1]|uniref:TldD/PmbA family protein n=1 Tax=Candidatus Izimoplasma sp. ZiA1 TaxID=2024899 RepID=UPI000BAA40C1|nr:hypothetical protein CI105_01125 [Candidatus Izimaplasma bacterium ZiA1]